MSDYDDTTSAQVRITWDKYLYQAIRYIVSTMIALVIVGVGTPLLAIFGRSHHSRPGELVVDDVDLGVDDRRVS